MKPENINNFFNLSEDEQYDIEDWLCEKYEYNICFHEADVKYFYEVGKYTIGIWFNDTFGWALSFEMTFAPRPNDTVEECLDGFDRWYNKEGKKFRKRLKAVKYPVHTDKTYKEDLENFFNQNCLIGIEIEDSIDKFCGRKINNGFNRENVLERIEKAESKKKWWKFWRMR